MLGGGKPAVVVAGCLAEEQKTAARPYVGRGLAKHAVLILKPGHITFRWRPCPRSARVQNVLSPRRGLFSYFQRKLLQIKRESTFSGCARLPATPPGPTGRRGSELAIRLPANAV